MITKQELYNALRLMGREYLKPRYKEEWTPQSPTTGYCYIVAEVVYHYLAPKGSRPYVMKTTENDTHWFIMDPEGKVIDLTADQFIEPVDYSNAKPQNFLTKQISKRGKVLAELLGLTIASSASI
jgi:hypothetical protein